MGTARHGFHGDALQQVLLQLLPGLSVRVDLGALDESQLQVSVIVV